jgi:hypothetical protein
MSYLFEKLAKVARASGVNIRDVVKGREFFRNAAKQIRSADGNALMNSDPSRFIPMTSVGRNTIGKMMMFYYDATTKEDLPYWDRFPLIFPLKRYQDGFLGINLHYLHPMSRARLMNALYSTNQHPGTEQQRLEINYRILKTATKYRLFAPCVKRYKWKGVKSRLFVIRPEEWDMMLMLPLERFDTWDGKGVAKGQVWADSMRALAKR